MRKFLVAILMCIFCASAYAACTSAQIDVLGDGAQCETAKFTITTTNLSANTKFKFYMSAQGTFYVDWGDGTVDTIMRSDTTETLYDHTYTTGGVKTIRFGGGATGYTNNAPATIRFATRTNAATIEKANLINEIHGSLGAIFPTLGQNEAGQPKFVGTFGGSNITEIPEGLFSGIYGNVVFGFAGTFADCESLTTIPENLFANITGGSTAFGSVFKNCKSLTSIPAGLFNNLTTGAVWMFSEAFAGCTSLTSIPAGLFSSLPNAANYMFYATFYGCTNLTGYISPSTFAGLIENGHPTATDMWADTFTGTALATSCPSGTVPYTTGYESYWGGRVACMPECSGGQYYNLDSNACGPCPAGTYSTGNTWVCSAVSGGYYNTGCGTNATGGVCDANYTGGTITAGYFSSGGGKSPTPTSNDCTSGNTCGQCTTDPTTGRPAYTDAAGGASSCSVCPAVTGELASRVTSYNYYPRNPNAGGINSCYAFFHDNDPTGYYGPLCYYNATDGGYGGEHSVCQSDVPVSCAAGYGSIIQEQPEWGGGNATWYGIDSMNGRVCGPCATGYDSPEDSITCNANTVTISWDDGDNNPANNPTTQCTYDGGISTPTTIPTKRGHVFNGWKFTQN